MEATIESLVISISGLRGKGNEWVAKELAYIFADEDKNVKAQSYVFLPPYPDTDLTPDVQYTNDWIVKHLGVPPWKDGLIPYPMMETIVRDVICNTNAPVYAKGSELVAFLNTIVGSKKVHDLDEIKCPRADDIEGPSLTCGVASHIAYNCALNKAMKYTRWVFITSKNERQQEQVEGAKEQPIRVHVTDRGERSVSTLPLGTARDKQREQREDLYRRHPHLRGRVGVDYFDDGMEVQYG